MEPCRSSLHRLNPERGSSQIKYSTSAAFLFLVHLHLLHQLVNLLERMAFVLRRQEERTKVAGNELTNHQHTGGTAGNQWQALFSFPSGNLQSIVIRRVRLRMIRWGQCRHFEAIDGVEVEESLYKVVISSCRFLFIIDFLDIGYSRV